MDSLVVTTALIEAALVAAALSVVFTTTLVFVPKNATAARLCAVAAMAGLTRLFYIPLWKVFTRPAYRANFDSLTCVAFMNSAEIVFVSRVDAMELSGGKGHPQVDTVTLFWRAMCLLCNWRRAGTRWEIPNLKWRGPRSRARFLATILAKLSLAYLIMDAIDSAELPEVHFFAEEKQTLFRFWKLSSEDIVFRTFATIGLWVSSLLFNYMNNTSVAFLSVLTGLSKPEAWPYVNGSLSAIYTVRGFWR